MMDIVTIGELLIDFTVHGRSENGMLLFEQNPGGAVSNMVAAAARLGARTAFIGKVGNDMHGLFLKETLQNANIDVSNLLVSEDAFTTLAFVSLSQEGERTFSFARKPGADTCIREDELDSALLSNTRVFHSGSLSLTVEPSRTATYRAIAAAKAAGAVISYDPNYRATLWQSEAEAVSAMRSLVPTADIMKISDEELPLLTGFTDPVEAARALYQQGVAVVAVTLGGKGAMVLVGEETRFIPGYPTKVVDTTGAGDAFFGGFLYQFLQIGCSPRALTLEQAANCAALGNATASLCVEGRGGIPSMPSLGKALERQASRN